jgi:hypothetical protein
MKIITQHRFSTIGINEKFCEDNIEKSYERLINCENVNLARYKDLPNRLVILSILENRKAEIRKYMQLWVDMGVEHFNRVLASENITIRLGNRTFEVAPESETEKKRVDYIHWYNLFFPAYLLQYNERIEEFMNIDLEKLIVVPNDYNRLLVEYIKAWQNSDRQGMISKLEAIRIMSQSDETTYFSLKGVSKASKKGIAESRTLVLLPIIEMLDAAYQKNGAAFNALLENHLVNKREYIKRRKMENFWDHWIDFPALSCCAYALEQGINIEVESDYIPAWFYRREF